MLSGSSAVVDYLSQFLNGHQFTAKGVYNDLIINPKYVNHHITEGSVGGVLSKMAAMSILTTPSKNGRRTNYVLTGDPALYRTLIHTSRGSSPGRTDGPHRSRKIPTRESVKDELTNLASQIMDVALKLEQLEAPLTTISTEDLLKELMRRQKNA